MNVDAAAVSLREITFETVIPVTRPVVAESQEGFVAPSAISLAPVLFTRLQLSYVPGPGCAEPFYLGVGFRHTGRVDGNEIVLELTLQDS